MADISEYKVGIVLSCEDVSKKGGKPMKVLKVDIGSGDEGGIPIVTTAPNVRDGSRVVVAPAGSTVVSEEGEEIQLTNSTVGGHPSWGMICDSRMLGWSGGAAGVAVQIDESYPVGAAPPTSKPRPNQQQQEEVPSGPVTDGLFQRKLTKEEKKKLAAEKRAAKKAAKEAEKAKK
mmetsp:Transcript_25811/g.63231  ORF Transcript_25811/g.63231 Transcript_25811/m.63231 type:complete len:175 (+) Transcript_25811:203-727(+)|eukprot:CAMPEP_0113608002 /NCGR_PEP_ID=MMETSP0017_2-20120614/3688_1 /TAXON_ID=2856 /ORGANISM="Cylindrotheca closterium" /LENGTH=174 /DNA_ID=CAMNT_0000516649 /DNA_START=69 /DNA_END=593 /DNA_ORIENTATION=- /assembly_acc=CAM_ASM_000147